MESSRQLKMGSLFDGSGGFPLASMLCDIQPVWASEIEPFPIRVTKNRFPHMKHYGDISKIDVETLETVDLISGGSPCQDMSVAGKRQGMSKQCTKCSYRVVGNADINECPECGAELEYTRSGLFMEQIRIVKEMRKKDELEQLRSGRTNEHVRPRFMLWENVVGAFSSNNGEDFRAVLEETARIKEPSVIIPRPAKGKWTTSGCVVGDGWSIAWRVLDAQYWGVPQRRRRIALVADFGGECAGEILFKREGLRRNFTESRKAWQGITGNIAEGIGEASEPFCYNGENLTSPLNKQNPQPGDPCHTLGTDPRNYVMEPQLSAIEESADITEKKQQYSVDFGRTADRIQMNADKAVTLLGEGGGCGAKTGLYCLPKDICYGIDRAAFNQGENALYDFGILNDQTPTLIARGPNAVCHATDVGWLNSCEDVSPTLLSRMYKDPHLVTYQAESTYWDGGQIAGTLTKSNANGAQRMPDKDNFNAVITPEYIVRRLTPLECSRLQGFPDWWTDGLQNENPTEEDLEFWREVFETHREIVTGASKPKTDKQIIKWLQEEPNDGAMYKMWGNGIALPCFLYVIEGIKEVLDRTSSNSSIMTSEVN
ncbi:MAG: DNA cytosine methyltransferase [Bacteroidaceae bacterium]|nr:DNA cytosine methyltransferase [Bacteroidaceae bacterium]